MPWPHLFEFMDLPWLPAGLRDTLREVLECGNSRPFRRYYEWVADKVIDAARAGGLRRVVELGAGTAPVTRHLAADPRSAGLSLVMCDNNPDRAAYRDLEARFPGQVTPHYEPVDFSRLPRQQPDTLLFLSATLHHVPSSARAEVVAALTRSSGHVLIFEPLRRSLLSVLFVLPSLVPALLLPLWYFNRGRRWRRFLWCWLLPVAPLMFWWDGVISCLRQWDAAEWWTATGPEQLPRVEESLFCQMIHFEATADHASTASELSSPAELSGVAAPRDGMA